MWNLSVVISLPIRYTKTTERVIFDQWPKLKLGFDVRSEIPILKVIYSAWHGIKAAQATFKIEITLPLPIKL